MKSWLISGCLALAGCCPIALRCSDPVTVHVVACPVNAAPLAHRDPPAFAGDTYRDLAEHAVQQRSFGLSCEADKGAVKRQLDAIAAPPEKTPR